jgi:type VI secretion system secreted protein VgrG
MITGFDIKIKSIKDIKGISFKLVDSISKLFSIELKFETEEKIIDTESLVNEEVTIKISTTKDKYFNGIIESIEMEEIDTYKVFDKRKSRYIAIIRPKLFLLSKTNSYKIFQKKTTNKIIEEILKSHQIDHKIKTTKCGNKVREFCVQHNESDLNFVMRLMEDEGLFFHFEHSNSNHRLIIRDNHHDDSNLVSGDFYNFNHDLINNINRINSIKTQDSLISKSIKLMAYNHLTPTKIDKYTTETTSKKKYGELKFDYFGHTDLSDIGTLYRDIDDEKSKSIIGNSTCFDIISGGKIELKKHPISNLNNKKYLIVHIEESLDYEAKNSQIYMNNFIGIPNNSTFKVSKITPRPTIAGIETATVIGDKEDEVNTNENGEIKVKFHWDESTEKETSCWIRVMQKSAGNHHGHLQLPRVGQEVIVSFIQGNPDLPIIIGSLYNGKNKPKYLTQSKTVDYWTSTSVGPNSEKKFNEIKFENKNENEEIYIHAQKDFKTEVENSYDITTKESYMHINLKKGDFLLQLDESNILIDVKKGKIVIKAEQDIEVQTKHNISMFAEKDISIKSNQNISIEAKNDINIKSKNLTMKIVEKIYGEAKNIFKKASDMINLSSKNAEISSSSTLDIKNQNTNIKATSCKTNATNFNVSATKVDIEGKAGFTAKSSGKTVVKGTMVELG